MVDIQDKSDTSTRSAGSKSKRESFVEKTKVNISINCLQLGNIRNSFRFLENRLSVAQNCHRIIYRLRAKVRLKTENMTFIRFSSRSGKRAIGSFNGRTNHSRYSRRGTYLEKPRAIVKNLDDFR